MVKTDRQSGIIYRTWQVDDPRAVLLLVHGLGAHSGRWRELAEYFLRERFSSYAIELEGFGVTEALQGHVDSFGVYYRDILSLAGIISKENPGKNIFLLGESLGGLISFIFYAGRPEGFSGLVCLAPSFSIRMQVSLWDYLRVFFSLFLNSRKQFPVHFISSMCTRDPQSQKVIDEDIREHRLVTAKFMFNYFKAERSSRSRVFQIKAPVLFLVPGEDKLVSPQASRNIFAKIPAADKQLIEYPEMYHALSVEMGREKVFNDILAWLEKRL